MTDAVRTFAATLREYHARSPVEPVELACSANRRWNQGIHILQLMDLVILEQLNILYNLCDV